MVSLTVTQLFNRALLTTETARTTAAAAGTSAGARPARGLPSRGVEDSGSGR